MPSSISLRSSTAKRGSVGAQLRRACGASTRSAAWATSPSPLFPTAASRSPRRTRCAAADVHAAEMPEQRRAGGSVAEHDEVAESPEPGPGRGRRRVPMKSTVPSAGAITAVPAGAASSSPSKNSSAPVHGERRGPNTAEGSTSSVGERKKRRRRGGDRRVGALARREQVHAAVQRGDVPLEARRRRRGVGAGEQARLGVQGARPVGRRDPVEEGDAAREARRVGGAFAHVPDSLVELAALGAGGRGLARQDRRALLPEGSQRRRRNREPQRDGERDPAAAAATSARSARSDSTSVGRAGAARRDGTGAPRATRGSRPAADPGRLSRAGRRRPARAAGGRPRARAAWARTRGRA